MPNKPSDPDLFTDHPDRPIKKRRTRGKAIKRGVPTREEWALLSRQMYANAKELLEHRDPDTNLPSMSPALMTSVSKLIMESETVYKEDEKKQKDLSSYLSEKRAKRQLRIIDDPHTNKPITPAIDLGFKTELPPVEVNAIEIDEEESTLTYEKTTELGKRGIHSSNKDKY